MELGIWAVTTSQETDVYADVWVDLASDPGVITLRAADGSVVRTVGGELLHLSRVDVPGTR